MRITDQAHMFAAGAHAAVGQTRKYTGEDYIRHPEAVAKIVRDAGGCDEMIAAALLHDVVEDTGVQISTIREFFGGDVAALVSSLTDISTKTDGNRDIRKAIDRAHSAAASPDAQTIKVADLIDNTRSIVQHDPHFAVTYMREKRLLLNVLTKADPVLRATAEGQIRAYEEAQLQEALR